jgi:hypothetical protein
MCCFFAALLFFGPRLAILIWWIVTPVYVSTLFDSWFWPILAWIFLPWTLLMYMLVAPGGLVGFDWLILGLGIFADIAQYASGYANRKRVPYGDQVPDIDSYA